MGVVTAVDFRNAFGGSWERGEREIWGLVERDGRALKIEVLATSTWRCSIFERGACVASSAHEDALEAVCVAMRMLER